MNLTGIFNAGIPGIIMIVLYALSFVLPVLIGLYLLLNFLRAPGRKLPSDVFSDPVTRFIILIPARNEESVIGHTVGMIKDLDYPKDMTEIVIIADNCTDKTAEKAKEAGAKVFERSDNVCRSKAYALDWFFKSGFLDEGKWDAICIVDADTVLHPDFLRRIDIEMADGYSIVHGRSGSINPHESFTASFMTVLLSFQNRFWHLPQANIRRSGFFAGTGVCITVKCLREVGWNIHTLVEDAEFGIQAVLKGYSVRYCDHAEFYVEQVNRPLSLWKQQRRWRTGHIACLGRYGPALIKEVFFRNNKNAIAPLILVMIPPFCIAALFQMILAPAMVLAFFGPGAIDPVMYAAAFTGQFMINFILQSFVLFMDQRFSIKHWKGICGMFLAPVFYGILDIICIVKPIKEWHPMNHGETDYKTMIESNGKRRSR